MREGVERKRELTTGDLALIFEAGGTVEGNGLRLAQRLLFGQLLGGALSAHGQVSADAVNTAAFARLQLWFTHLAEATSKRCTSDRPDTRVPSSRTHYTSPTRLQRRSPLLHSQQQQQSPP